MTGIPLGGILQGTSNNFSKVMFENDLGISKRDEVEGVSSGPSTIRLKSPENIPLLHNLRQLEVQKSYSFINPQTFKEPILMPAGYIGRISAEFLEDKGIDYAPTNPSPFLQTLNLEGDIASIVTFDSGSAILVTTVLPHGLQDGQYVNLNNTGVTPYNQLGLIISNVTASAFVVQIPFISVGAIGDFNTGFRSPQLFNLHMTHSTNDSPFMDIKSAGAQFTSLIMKDVGVALFTKPGIIRNGVTTVLRSVLFTLTSGGLTLDDCDTVALDKVDYQPITDQITDYDALTIKGPKTRDYIITTNKFQMLHENQTPIHIESSVINAESIQIMNSPDRAILNSVYFNPAGLDQTDPQVITKNNGTRLNSMASAQVGFTNIANPIIATPLAQGVPVLIGGVQFISNNLERATANSAGQLIIKSKVTKKYPITFSGLIERVSGNPTDIGILLVKNGLLDLSATFEVPRSVNPGVIQVSATRDFLLKEDDMIELAVVDFNSTTSDIAISQANYSYSVEA